MASYITNRGKRYLIDRGAGTIDLVGDTIKVALLTSAATPSVDNDYMTSYTATELSCTGYVAGYGGAGRKTLPATKAWTQDNTNDLAQFTTSTGTLTWTTCGAAYAGSPIAHVLLIKEVTNDAASPVISYHTLAATVMPNGGDLVLTWDSTNGILQFKNA